MLGRGKKSVVGFGQAVFAIIFEGLSFESFWGSANWMYCKDHEYALDSLSLVSSF